MTATFGFYAGDLFRFNEAKTETRYFDIVKRFSNRTAFYRHFKSIIHLETLYQKILSSNFLFTR